MDAPDQNILALEQRSIGAIERIQELTVRLPFVRAFSTSTATWTCKEALLLRVDGDGLTGWGECVADPDPYYAPETTATVHHVLENFLIPLLKPGLTLQEVAQRFCRVRGHDMAKAVIESALLDLIAKRAQIPLHALLGHERRPIPSGISIGLQRSRTELLDEVAEAVATGYHRVKIKIQRGQDVELVEAIRERFPDIALMVDANGDYELEHAEHLRQLDRFDLIMIEQPLSYRDIHEHALLQRVLSTPLCLDESIRCLGDARAAIALGSCRIINIKPGRVGGLLESLRIAELARAHEIPVWAGGMDETGIGRAANIHLQTAPAFSLPGDTSETRRYFEEDIVEPPVRLDEEGFVAVPEGHGLGVQIRADALKKHCIHTARLR